MLRAILHYSGEARPLTPALSPREREKKATSSRDR
jgi:hypothetical protein